MARLKDVLCRVSKWQVNHPFAVLGIILAITIVFLGGISQVQTVAAIEKMIPESAPEVEYFNQLRDQFEGKDSIAIVVRINDDAVIEDTTNDITSYEVTKYIHQLQNEISENTRITSTQSLADRAIMRNFHEYEESGFPDQKTYNQMIESDEFQQGMNAFIDHSKKTSLIMATTDVGTIDDEMNALANHLEQQIDDFGHPRGIEVEVTGSPVLQQQLGNMIDRDQFVTFTLAAVFIFITLLILFKHLFSSLAPLFTVTIAAIWLYGTMGYFNLPISTLAGSVASIVMGLGIDYGIHILHRYSHERKAGKLIRESADLSIVNTGSAVIATTATTLAAFFAFQFGLMPEMARFGGLLMIGIFYAMILSLFGLPAMLVIEEKIKYKLKRSGGIQK